MRILILADRAIKNAQTMRDHIKALEQSSHRVFVCDMIHDIPLFVDLAQFDALVVHYTLSLFLTHYLSLKTRAKIRRFKGLKTCFIQDEYRFVNKTIEAIKDLGIELIFTCVPPSEFENVYTSRLKGVTCVNVLTGYVPEALTRLEVPSYADRKIDVSYRARTVPYYLGELGQEKWKIGYLFLKEAQQYSLATDIECSEKKRLYGKKWIDFLCQSKACLGVESGASVFDFTGDIQRNVQNYLNKNKSASFEEVQALFFADKEGKIKLNQISPRCFEAAALRTLMILYEGEYSGILISWRHYVPLKKDHSNMAEVVEVIKNPQKAAKIIQGAFEEIALNPAYSFQKLTAIFDKTMESHFLKKGIFSQKQPLNLYRKYRILNRIWVVKKYFKKMSWRVETLYQKLREQN